MASSPKWNFFMHGTNNIQNVMDMFKSGKIKPGENSKVNSSENANIEESPYYCKHAVYCQYIFSEMPRIKDLSPMFEWHYYMRSYIIILDPVIAKHFEMIVCNSVSMGDCIDNPKNKIMHTPGNLSRMPSLKKLKTHILDRINLYKIRKLDITNSYNYEHEALFPEIPIEYIRAILVPSTYGKPNYKKELEQFVKKNNLPIKIIKYSTSPYSKNFEFHQYFEQI